MAALHLRHLRYFWAVVRHGGVGRAAAALGVAHATVSEQVRALERALGERLLERRGRGVVPTEAGRVALRYAEDIFALGDELVAALHASPGGRPLRLRAGVADTLPKSLVRLLLEPARRLPQGVRLLCREGTAERLVSALAAHELDVVLVDAPAPAPSRGRVFSHLLADCGVTVLAVPRLAAALAPGFPGSLDRAPLLLPAPETSLRRALDSWFVSHRMRPTVIGEFDDSALLKSFGQAGAGAFPVPALAEELVRRQYGVEAVGRIEQVRARVWAVSAERRIQHPAVALLCDASRVLRFA